MIREVYRFSLGLVTTGWVKNFSSRLGRKEASMRENVRSGSKGGHIETVPAPAVAL